jgi:hypothetical protein
VKFRSSAALLSAQAINIFCAISSQGMDAKQALDRVRQVHASRSRACPAVLVNRTTTPYFINTVFIRAHPKDAQGGQAEPSIHPAAGETRAGFTTAKRLAPRSFRLARHEELRGSLSHSYAAPAFHRCAGAGGSSERCKLSVPCKLE